MPDGTPRYPPDEHTAELINPDQDAISAESNATIREQAVRNVSATLTGDPDNDLKTLRTSLDSKNLTYGDIFTYQFQVMRMGTLGFRLPVAEEDREKFNLFESELTTNGPDEAYEENSDYSEEEMTGSGDFFTGVGLMRAFIASTFLEESRLTKTSPPKFHDELIDVYPVPESTFRQVAELNKNKNLSIMSEEEALENWQKEHPALYNETRLLSQRLAAYFTPRTLAMYRSLPQEFKEKMTPALRKQWQEELMRESLRVYTWFSPNPPNAIRLKDIQADNPPQISE